MNHFLIKNPFIFEILSFSFTFSAFSQKSISLIILMHSYSYFNALAIISASYKAARAKEYSFLILWDIACLKNAFTDGNKSEDIFAWYIAF